MAVSFTDRQQLRLEVARRRDELIDLAAHEGGLAARVIAGEVLAACCPDRRGDLVVSSVIEEETGGNGMWSVLRAGLETARNSPPGDEVFAAVSDWPFGPSVGRISTRSSKRRPRSCLPQHERGRAPVHGG
jgi:hypothetical protein